MSCFRRSNGRSTATVSNKAASLAKTLGHGKMSVIEFNEANAHKKITKPDGLFAEVGHLWAEKMFTGRDFEHPDRCRRTAGFNSF